MASLTTIREALATTIQTHTGLRSYARIPGSPLTPCVVIEPDSSEAQTFRRGLDEYTMTVHVISGPATSDEAAQRWLDEAVTGNSSASVRKAIFEHPTLGTASDEMPTNPTATMSITCLGFREYGVTNLGESQHWSAKLVVAIQTRGDV